MEEVEPLGVSLDSSNEAVKELKRREAELQLINRVQQGISGRLKMSEIYSLAGEELRQFFDAQVAGIATFDFDKNMEDIHYLFENGERHFPPSQPITTARQYLIDNKGIILFNENVDENWERLTGEKNYAVPGTRNTKSAVYVPMLVEDRVRGYLTIQNLDRENAFSESDVRALGTLTNSLSIAFENARLFSETEQRNAELAVINSVQEGLVAEMDMQGIYDLVGEKIRELFDAQVADIAIFDYEKRSIDYKYSYEAGKRYYHGSRKIDLLREKLIADKNFIYIKKDFRKEVSKIIGVEAKALPGTKLPQSALYVPMLVGDIVKGYVSLQNIDRENAFSDGDIRLLSTLVNSMSIALENARLFNETEQRNAELAVINSVQQGLVAEMDMRGIYDLVGDRIRDLFDAQIAMIATFNHENGTEIFQYLIEDGNRQFFEPRPIDKIRQLLIKKKELIHINENIDERWEQLTGEIPAEMPGTKVSKSALYVPMLVGDTVKGYVSLQNIDRENAFSDGDIRLLSTLVNSMSIALENARLFNETEQRNAELAVINSVQQGLVAEMDMQGIYDLVGDRIRDLFDAQVAAIATFNHEKGTEIFQYIIEDGNRQALEARPIDKIRQLLINKKELICINENIDEVWAELTGEPSTVVPGTQLTKSVLYVPMLVGDTVRGYVSLQNIDRENAFSEADVRLLSTLVNSMSIALENARLFNETTRLLEETAQHATELQTVNKISHALVSQLDFNGLIQLIGEQMRTTFHADIVYLALHDRKNNTLDFPYTYGDNIKSRPFGKGITEKIILNKEPLLVNQDLADTYEKIEAEKSGKWVESYLGVPIIVGEEAIGVISVQSTERKNRFSENDLRLLNTVAANVGIAMQNAEAYQKLQAALFELKSAQEQLVQQEKLASLGQLTAGIAHEIKNPLNFVNNFSDLNIELIEEVMEELKSLGVNSSINSILETLTDVKANLEKVHQHGKRADSIVKSMLQHSRGGSGILAPTDLNSLIREYVNLSFHGMRAGKKAINVSINLELGEEVSMVPLIGEDFSRVILNLCNNAFDAMREKANSKNAPQDYLPKLTVRSRRDNAKVFIEVEDNGMGIPEDLKDKILQPFFTTKKGTEGTGLGLSITNDIIKAHGGVLNISSKENKGTNFIIEIPK
ncbi:MAG TPA: GAF domain-containing protein [Salinimicrobium sp.]|nr:GAF domain-containing protein [Salinimicrobium sp.]